MNPPVIWYWEGRAKKIEDGISHRWIKKSTVCKIVDFNHHRGIGCYIVQFPNRVKLELKIEDSENISIQFSCRKMR